MNPKRKRGVACSDVLGCKNLISIRTSSCRANLARCRARYRLELRKLVLDLRILFHKTLYHLYLARKRLLLPFYIRRARLSLIDAERYLVAKHGRDWRLCVFDDQVVQFLKVRDYVHARMQPNVKSSGAPNPGRPGGEGPKR
jgi:hypothetical protein